MIKKLYGYGGIDISLGGSTVSCSYDRAYGWITPEEDFVLDKDEDGNHIKTSLGWHLRVKTLFEHMNDADAANILGIEDLCRISDESQVPLTICPKRNSSAINSLTLEVIRLDVSYDEPDRLQYYETVEMNFITKIRLPFNPLQIDILDVYRLVTAAGDKILTADGKYIAVKTRR